MAKAARPTPGDDDRDIADAASLFDDVPRPSSAPEGGPEAMAGDEVFELEGGDPPGLDEIEPAAPIPQRTVRPKDKPAPEERKARRAADESAKVEQVWSRGA